MNNNNNNKQQRKRGQRANQAAAFNAVTREIQLLRAAAKVNGGNAQPKRRNRRARKLLQGNGPQNVGGGAGIGGYGQFFAPVSQGYTVRKTQPRYVAKTADRVRLIHREKVAKVTSPGTAAFTILKALALNPGLYQTFPWLANEAQGFESYVFHRIRVIWLPALSSATVGSVIMGPDYDSADAAPFSETALSSYTDAEEGSFWVPFCIDLTPDLLRGDMRRRYIRNGTLAANLDIKTYDSANVYVACADDATANIGKIWIEYDVEMFNPQVPPGGFFRVATLQGGGGTMAASTPFGAVPVAMGSPTLAGAATNVLSLTGLIAGQVYVVSAHVVGTVISVFTIAATSGVTFRNGGFNSTQVNAAATVAHQFESFIATAETGSITFTIAATTVTASDVVVAVLAPEPGF